MACTTVLPTFGFVDNCPTIKRGQVYRLFITRATTVDVLTDVTDPDEWADRLDQDDAVPAANVACSIRQLSGIGAWGAGEVTDVEIPLDQVFSLAGNKVLTFKVYDLTPANRAAIVAYRDAGTSQVKIWTQQDDTILGGNAGVNGSLRADIIVPEGRTELQYGEFVFTTKNSINAIDDSPLDVL